MLKPKLRGVVRLNDDQLSIEESGTRYIVGTAGGMRKKLLTPLKLMDGRNSIQGISRKTGIELGTILELVETLKSNGLVMASSSPKCRSALEVLFDLEDLSNELLYESIYKNPFWKALLSDPHSVPLNVFYGMAIENYHFLFRESYFDAPALNYPASTRARILMNEFYAEENGHDELILKALEAIGLSREELTDTIPLPRTMALCNALAFWARYDAVFFFSTLGVLEGKDLKVDSFVTACETKGLSDQFIRPIRQHAEINMKGEHGSLTRAIFAHLPPMTEDTVLRLKAQTRLFVSIYDAFYRDVWNHYNSATRLLRRISALEGN